MLSAEQQDLVYKKLMAELAPRNAYERDRLRVEFKQAMVAIAREMSLPAAQIDEILATDGGAVFSSYAVLGGGQGIGLFALVRVYRTSRGQDAADELRQRMQDMAERNASPGALGD